MKNLRRFFPLLCTAMAVILTLGLAACGVDESTSSAARPGDPPPTVDDDRVSNPSDTSLTAIDFETSLWYDAASDKGFAFFAFRDQDGNSIWDFKKPSGTPGFNVNGRNFTIQLFPSIAPRNLDPQTFAVSTLLRTTKVVALVIDVSGSMDSTIDPDDDTSAKKIDVAKQAAKNFVDKVVVNPGDMVALVSFSTDGNIISGLTDDKDFLKEKIDALQATGSTNFGGALTQAVKAVGIQPGKRAVVFLTDGDDTVDTAFGPFPAWDGAANSLRYQALEKLKSNELTTYCVGLGTGISSGLADLDAFADQTGGVSTTATDAASLDTFFDDTVSAIDGLTGETSPYVSFPNDYPSTAGPIQTRISLLFENGNGKLSAATLGTFVVPGN